MDDHSGKSSFWRYGFSALVLFGVATVLVVCAGAVGASPLLRSHVVLGFVWVVTGIYFAAILAKPDDAGDLLPWVAFSLGFLALAGMPILLSGRASRAATWIFYGAVALICVIATRHEKDKARPQAAMRALMYLWVVLLTIIGLADTRFFAHPVPPLPAGVWSVLLDARLLVGLTLGLILVGKAITQVAQLPAPPIPELPEIGMQPLEGDSPSILMAILRPLSVVVVLFLEVVRSTTNFLWELLAGVAVALARFVREVAVLVAGILLNKEDLSAVVRLVTGFLGLISVVHLSRMLSANAVHYLRHETAPLSDVLPGEASMAVVILFYAVLVLLVAQTVVVWEWDRSTFRALSAGAAFAGTVIALALTASSVISHFTARWPALHMVGFDRLGPFTGIMLVICSVMFVYMIAKQLVGERWRLAADRSTPVSAASPGRSNASSR